MIYVNLYWWDSLISNELILRHDPDRLAKSTLQRSDTLELLISAVLSVSPKLSFFSRRHYNRPPNCGQNIKKNLLLRVIYLCDDVQLKRTVQEVTSIINKTLNGSRILPEKC